MNNSKLLALTLSLALAACGGDGGGTTNDLDGEGDGDGGGSSTTGVSGTAAAGAPMAGFVAIKDSAGTTRTVDIDDDGGFSLDLEGLTAPYLLYASGLAGGKAYTLYSAATGDDEGGTVNITPLTDLVVANVVGTDTEEFFNAPDFSKLTGTALDAAKGELKAMLREILTAASVSDDFDLMNSPFTPDRTGFDAVLDVIEVSVDRENNTAIITNRLDPSQSVTDDFAALDSGTLDVGSADIGGTVEATVAIRQVFLDIDALVAGGTATEANLANHIDADFLHASYDQAGFIGLLLSDSEAIAYLREHFLQAGADAPLETLAGNTAEIFLDGAPFFVGFDGERWRLKGDQRKWGAYVEVEHHWDQAGTHNVENDLWVDIFYMVGAEYDDSVFVPGDYVTVQGPGITGEAVLDAGDENAFEYTLKVISDSERQAVTDGAQYTFTRYNSSGVLQEQYTRILAKGPLLSSELGKFLTITSPTHTELSQFSSGGELAVTWDLPAGLYAQGISFEYYDLSDELIRQDEVDVAADATSGTIDVTAPGEPTNHWSLDVYARDVFGNNLATGLYYVAP